MTDTATSDPVERAEVLHRARETITRATMQFPVSQILVPWADSLDWLLDEVATDKYWLDELGSLHRGFAPRWEHVAQRALGPRPRVASDRALLNADYDPLNGREPWGAELTHVLRATFADLEEFGDEASRVFPTDERTRAFVRAVRTQTGSAVLPVLSYVPLQESEWRAIIGKLNELIDLTLRFEGAVAVWLIGAFARDVEGRLQLRPQLSFEPPQSGVRVKLLRIILGTAYEEQCPSLLPLVRAARAAQSRPSDKMLTETPWHRLVVQVDATTDDYVLLNFSELTEAEDEIARQVMQINRQPREPHELQGTVHRVPRPYQSGESVPVPAPMPPGPTQAPTETTILPPRPAIQAADQSAEPVTVAPDAASLSRDAEELRRKGMAAVSTNPAIAQKYLLASTVLENNSVDVWLTLVDIASNDKQRSSFRREAEKVLRRQHNT